MIIGNGLLAQSFAKFDSSGYLFFASGVSNSLETDPAAFAREKELLLNSIRDFPDYKLIYFSTSSIYDSSKTQSPYVLHKLNMEKICRENAADFIIYRVGNVVGRGGNENTLFNFLVRKIKKGEEFLLFEKAKRPLIDVADVSRFVNFHKSCSTAKTVDISYPYQYTLKEIVREIELFLDTKASFNTVPEGDWYHMTFAPEIIHFFKDKNPQQYLSEVVRKYAGS